MLAVCLLGAGVARGAEAHWYGTVDEAVAEARASNRDILVDLYADWCLWCSRLDEQVFSRPRFEEEVGARYVFLRVDVEETEEGKDLQRRFRISSLPTTLLMTADRVEIGRIQGFFPLDPFLEQIAGREGDWKEFQARYEAESSTADRDTLTRLAVDLYERGDGKRAARIYEKLLPRTEPDSPDRAHIAYEIAESWRRGGALDRAEEAFAKATDAIAAASLEGSDLDARLALLRFHIDHDRGECRAAVSSLERFLERYPDNALASPARNTLFHLKQSESCV